VQSAKNGPCSTHEHEIGQQRASCATEPLDSMGESELADVRGALLLSASDAAQLLGIGRSHFYALHSCGRLGPQPVMLGRRTLWRKAELESWVAANCPVRQKWQVIRELQNEKR